MSNVSLPMSCMHHTAYSATKPNITTPVFGNHVGKEDFTEVPDVGCDCGGRSLVRLLLEALAVLFEFDTIDCCSANSFFAASRTGPNLASDASRRSVALYLSMVLEWSPFESFTAASKIMFSTCRRTAGCSLGSLFVRAFMVTLRASSISEWSRGGGCVVWDMQFDLL